MIYYYMMVVLPTSCFFFFFFNDTATTEIYTLSLHDALPIYPERRAERGTCPSLTREHVMSLLNVGSDRKSTRLNSSHLVISYAVFCLKKKKHIYTHQARICISQTQPQPGVTHLGRHVRCRLR